MKIGWENKRLSDIADISTGKWDANHAMVDGKYRFYTCAMKYSMCNTKKYSGPSLIIPGNGVNVGKVFYYDGDFDAYQRTYILNNIKINPRFLYYHMLLYWKELGTKLQYGSATNFIKIGNFHNYVITFPAFNAQKKIVDILDEAFTVINKAKENAEKNLKNARELFDSYLQRIFLYPGKDWQKHTLKEISKVFGRGKSKHRPRNDKKLYNGKYPFIQTGDIRNSNHIITEFTQTYNEIGLAQSKLWPKGTICITIAANIAETGILTFDACFPDSIIGLVVNEKVACCDFVEYLLQYFKASIQKLGKGSAQANINLATFEKKEFPFPPLRDQILIVKKLNSLSDELSKLENIYQNKIVYFEELKKSILQKAFNGDLNISKQMEAV